ncbi:hypothetical protein [Streptomyces sp. NPDC056361]|uniref:AbiTii domain-containing protein n=1 Tax=Streptomyces sp. NPDC056361 TaxID=3345795 RepID=UPI0035E088B7
MRLVLVMGGHASAEPLKQWALRELQGYMDVPDEVPDYRRIYAPIQANARTPFNQLHRGDHQHPPPSRARPGQHHGENNHLPGRGPA